MSSCLIRKMSTFPTTLQNVCLKGIQVFTQVQQKIFIGNERCGFPVNLEGWRNRQTSETFLCQLEYCVMRVKMVQCLRSWRVLIRNLFYRNIPVLVALALFSTAFLLWTLYRCLKCYIQPMKCQCMTYFTQKKVRQ